MTPIASTDGTNCYVGRARTLAVYGLTDISDTLGAYFARFIGKLIKNKVFIL